MGLSLLCGAVDFSQPTQQRLHLPGATAAQRGPQVTRTRAENATGFGRRTDIATARIGALGSVPLPDHEGQATGDGGEFGTVAAELARRA